VLHIDAPAAVAAVLVAPFDPPYDSRNVLEHIVYQNTDHIRSITAVLEEYSLLDTCPLVSAGKADELALAGTAGTNLYADVNSPAAASTQSTIISNMGDEAIFQSISSEHGYSFSGNRGTVTVALAQDTAVKRLEIVYKAPSLSAGADASSPFAAAADSTARNVQCAPPHAVRLYGWLLDVRIHRHQRPLDLGVFLINESANDASEENTVSSDGSMGGSGDGGADTSRAQAGTFDIFSPFSNFLHTFRRPNTTLAHSLYLQSHATSPHVTAEASASASGIHYEAHEDNSSDMHGAADASDRARGGTRDSQQRAHDRGKSQGHYISPKYKKRRYELPSFIRAPSIHEVLHGAEVSSSTSDTPAMSRVDISGWNQFAAGIQAGMHRTHMHAITLEFLPKPGTISLFGTKSDSDGSSNPNPNPSYYADDRESEANSNKQPGTGSHMKKQLPEVVHCTSVYRIRVLGPPVQR